MGMPSPLISWSYPLLPISRVCKIRLDIFGVYVFMRFPRPTASCQARNIAEEALMELCHWVKEAGLGPNCVCTKVQSYFHVTINSSFINIRYKVIRLRFCNAYSKLKDVFQERGQAKQVPWFHSLPLKVTWWMTLCTFLLIKNVSAPSADLFAYWLTESSKWLMFWCFHVLKKSGRWYTPNENTQNRNKESKMEFAFDWRQPELQLWSLLIFLF